MSRSRPTQPWPLLVAVGAGQALLGSPGQASAQVDTSNWKCESCPFEKGASAAVEAGLGTTTERSSKFGDYTGLQRKGAFLVAGGEARLHEDGGLYGRVVAAELGLDSRSLSVQGGQEGVYAVRLGYAEIPHRLSDTSQTPFLGVGGQVLSLPAGFPAPTTGEMPLADALHPVDVAFKRTRFDAGFDWMRESPWSYHVSLRRDVRDGVQRMAGSFFSSSAQLPVPVDQATDQLEASAVYASRGLQASLSYQLSMFRNGADAVTWANPFTPVVPGSTNGQLALAPDNQFHQISASAGYEISPMWRASADVALGRMTQDAAFLAPTLNAALAATLPDLPASSLNGQVDTFNASVRIMATPIDDLRISGVYTRDVRDNRTDSLAYPAVSTDMFAGGPDRINQPFSFTRDRFKLSADYRAPASVKLSLGAEEDIQERNRQEVVTTRESTFWGRVGAHVMDALTLSLKLSHAQRRHSTYGIATWVEPPENPLLRKFNLADRNRDAGTLRADLNLGESITLGVDVAASLDDYNHTSLGLTSSRSAHAGADLSAVLTDQLQVHAFGQTERVRTSQAGSQAFAAADWFGRTKDVVDVAGIGAKYAALGGALDLNADLVHARSRSDMSVDAGDLSPPFPAATTTLDSLKLSASYRYSKKLTFFGGYWYERYRSSDWRQGGILPATVTNLLVFGEQPPRYEVNVLRLGLGYRF